MSRKISNFHRFAWIGIGTLALTLSWGLGQARETKSFPAGPGDTLIVQNDYGQVRVQGTDNSLAEVQIRRIAANSSQLENIVVLAEKSGGRLFVTSYFYDYQAESVYLDVLVPRTMNVVIWGANSAVELTSISGYVRAFTQTGLVTATDLTSAVSLTSDTGDILFRSRVQPSADIRLESVLGKVRCHLAKGLNLRGWIRAGGQLRWSDEVELAQGHLERQLGVGGPLLLASSLSGPVLVDIDLTLSSTPAVATNWPPREDPRGPSQSTRTGPGSYPERGDSSDRGPAPVLQPGTDDRAPETAPVLREPAPRTTAGTEEVVYTTGSDGTVDSGYALKVNVNWTYLNVSVRDRATNRSVPNLGVEDFLVYEDDQLQRIEKFESAEAPFSLLLLLDISGSTKDSMDLIKDASVAFTRQIKTNDQIAVATFNSRTTLVQDFTNDRRAVEQSIRRIRSGGGTAFYDALERSINSYMDGMEGRKAIVIFSDGEDNQLTGDRDNGSETTFRELYRDIQEVDSIIYPIFLNDRGGSSRSNRRTPRGTGSVIDILEDIMKGRTPPGTIGGSDAHLIAREQMQQIADQTGGRMYAPSEIWDLRNVYEEIADDLRVQYTLAYNSTNPDDDGRWREIRVKMRDRNDLAARTRRGYYSRDPNRTRP